MIKIKYYLIDGCSWNRSGSYEKILNSESEIDDFIQSYNNDFYDVDIVYKEILKSEDK